MASGNLGRFRFKRSYAYYAYYNTYYAYLTGIEIQGDSDWKLLKVTVLNHLETTVTGCP